MKHTIKIIAILALFAISFTSCPKDNNYVGHAHKARYEVVSLGEKNPKISVNYLTQKGIGYGNGISLETETSFTPWQHEFTFYDVFSFETTVNIEEEYGEEEFTPIKLLLYIDDKLVDEQSNGEHSFIVATYFFNE